MSDEVDFARIPTREDCPTCPETGARCALHQSMYHRTSERQQEVGLVVPTEHAHGNQFGRNDNQNAHEQSETSKRAFKELNSAKTQEVQMINAMKRMNFVDGRQRQNLSKRQKIRDRRQREAALQVPDPAKMAKQQEKAAKRAADPERIARLEAHRQNMTEKKALKNTRRARLVDGQKHKSKTVSLVDAADTHDAMRLARSLEQKYITDDQPRLRGPGRTRGQKAANDLQTQVQDLATVHSMPLDTGTDDFLARADSLIHQTLDSVQSTLSPADRKNLEEALSLVRTTQLLSSSHTYRPMDPGIADESIDRMIREPIADGSSVHRYRPIVEGLPIKQAFMVDDTSLQQESDTVLYGQLRGGAEDLSNVSQTGGAEQDMVMD